MALPKPIGRQYSAAFMLQRKRYRRNQLMILAFTGFFLSLFTILIILLQNRQADAYQMKAVDEVIEIPTGIGNVTLYATAKYIRAGSRINDNDFHEVLWPKNSVPKGAIRNKSNLVGKYAKNDISQGIPLEQKQLVGEKRYVALPITPGMRAVTIKIDSQSGLEGWANPGSRVDVSLTYVNKNELTSKVIVQNAKVLSFDGDLRPAFEKFGIANNGRATSGKTITLEVSPGDALKIQTSKRVGSLNLLMRAPEDDKSAGVLEVDKNAIDSGFATNNKKKACKKGSVKIGSREFLIDCDGNISALEG